MPVTINFQRPASAFFPFPLLQYLVVRRPRIWRRRLLAVIALLAFLFPPLQSSAQSQSDEYRVKAAFLFHFAQLVEWPRDALGSDGSPMSICVVGQNYTPGIVESTVEGKQIGPHPIRVLNLQESDNLRGCHVLFLLAHDKKHISAILSSLQNAAVLTVGESDNFVQQGGMIGFCVQENKIRFDINLLAAQRSNIKISSRLLLLAKSVVGDPGQG